MITSLKQTKITCDINSQVIGEFTGFNKERSFTKNITFISIFVTNSTVGHKSLPRTSV